MKPAFARSAALRRALDLHAAGSLDEASRGYHALHAADPRDSEVIFLMGVLCCDLGLFETACRYLEQALRIAHVFPEARVQLAVALTGMAELAICTGDLAAAETHLQAASQAAPGDAASMQALGRLALLQGDAAVAEARLLESLQRRPGNVDTLNWLGLAQLQLEKFTAAEHSLRAALALSPGLTQARNNLGLCLYHQARLSEAISCFNEVLARDPIYRNARTNLAVALRVLGRHSDARHELELVLVDSPDEIEALNNLGAVFQDLGESTLALKTLERAVALSPSSAAIRWNLSLTQLLVGDHRNGWANYEARWQGCDHIQGSYRMPPARAWQGEELNGKKLLLWSEQGFGDTLQFIRFADDAARRGAVVDVQAPVELVPLLRAVRGVHEVFSLSETPTHFDFHCPLLSLPYRLGVSLDPAQLHGDSAYLFAAAERVAHWGRRLQAHRGLKVGLVWAGNARLQSAEMMAVDRRRSLSLNRLAPLLSVPDCTFYSLQKGAAASELGQASGHSIHDFSSEWQDFSDTAAFIANLDLVISVDTAVAHLAGGLGKPVWLLNRYDTCWRWLLDRDDSPWYTSLRQFRQPRAGEWEAPVAAAASALAEAAAASA